MSHVVVIAGPNGAGKSTIAPYLLRDTLEISAFINADVIATGLSAYSPEKAAISAGRIMLQRINKLIERRADFAYETTLSARTYAPKLKRMKKDGYQVSICFLSLISSDLAQLRVAERVRQGGHDIPSETIVRRYEKGLDNFFNLYKNLADNWYFYDNSKIGDLRLVAHKNRANPMQIVDHSNWSRYKNKYDKSN